MRLRTRTDLLALAGQYANERKVPTHTVIKEILHYEIPLCVDTERRSSTAYFSGRHSFTPVLSGDALF